MPKSAVSAIMPHGLRYRRDFVTPAEEQALLEEFGRLPFKEFLFQGFVAKRRVVSYGYRYSFESFRLSPAEPIPAFLEELRARAAAWAGCEAEDFAAALLTEYPASAGIGWHKDVPPFGLVVGISLRGFCQMKFRKGAPRQRLFFTLPLEERSAYLLSGEAREAWEHHIALTRMPRYSITFRTLKPDFRQAMT